MATYLTELDSESLWFPAIELALYDPDGLLAYGGDLSVERILAAYRKGIFPWYGPGEPILWWSPSQRAIINPKTFKPAKSLKKFQRKHQYQVSINQATDQVIDNCALTRGDSMTWITREMRAAYQQLAQFGFCHSVEVWQDNQLIGGLYGVSVGQVFCGESMFSLRSNASKIALWYFCEHFSRCGGQMIDCQMMNNHLASLGAEECRREEFIQSLLSLRERYLETSCYQSQWLTTSPEVSG
ncbi:leucyl/phenylalanyl-tRNA--protein transferase [Vibrio sp.]|uniref:leucyl/phenylalanyl-tRNA--protein transferase n=1 Tax=Vibrio sp. TaxID=678 RepID=UPI003D098750